jgi:hypothetical protein
MWDHSFGEAVFIFKAVQNVLGMLWRYNNLLPYVGTTVPFYKVPYRWYCNTAAVCNSN